MEVADTVNNNGKTTSSRGKSEAKGTKQTRYYPTLQPISSTGDMTKVEYSGLVDKTPVEWKSLKNYELFSLSPDGLFPMMKVSRNKAVRLHDRNVEMVSGGRCHRILISSH